jgi:hypothetical protein
MNSLEVHYQSKTRLNDVRYINKYLEKINENANIGDEIVVFVETKNQRKSRLLAKYWWPLNYLYYTLDFILKRLFPKWKATLRIYFIVTKGRNRVLSLPEVLGRLISCGFEIIDYYPLNGHTYIRSRKVGVPAYNLHPTYGLLISLSRIGLNKRKFKVYKFRTMHPFAEYLQSYLFDKNQLKEGGKIAEDIRVTSYGRFLRKWWLDELPMIWNMVNGDMKLVGVRPLSEHFFSLYPKDMQDLRTRTKPGLVPPFYADMPKTLEEVIDSERKYLLAYYKAPFKTDWLYFWRAFSNIVFKKARSN